MGVFNCVPEEIQQKTYKAVEDVGRGVGTVVETGCEMPAAVCQQLNTQERRGIKRNLSFYNDQFATKFLDVSLCCMLALDSDYVFGMALHMGIHLPKKKAQALKCVFWILTPLTSIFANLLL